MLFSTTSDLVLAIVLVAGALPLALREPWRRPVLVHAVLTAVLTFDVCTVALPPHPTAAIVARAGATAQRW